jgi:hypothetical protein
MDCENDKGVIQAAQMERVRGVAEHKPADDQRTTEEQEITEVFKLNIHI